MSTSLEHSALITSIRRTRWRAPPLRSLEPTPESPSMIYESAHLIANSIALEGNLPAEIGAGVTLRRPTELEISAIRNSLGTSLGMPIQDPSYEFEFVRLSPTQMRFEPISSPDGWYYFVLSDQQGGRAVYDLEPALNLLNPSIELSVRVTSTRESQDAESKQFGMAPAQLHIIDRYYLHPGPRERIVMDAEEFRRADRLRASISSLQEPLAFIRNAVTILNDVRLVPHRSRLHVLGYFAVVESLIAHAPRLAESLDSISHQFQGKLELLTNQIGLRQLVEEHFGTDKRIWKRLYSYRSTIAHGGSINFDKEYSSLRSKENVVSFMALFSKQLVVNAVQQPQFYADIKEC